MLAAGALFLALRLAGDAPEADHMRRAAALVRRHGGVEATRVFTRMWLSLLGLWSWREVPVIPPEQILQAKPALTVVGGRAVYDSGPQR